MTLLNGSLEEYPFKADETWLNMLKEARAKNVAKFETREQSDQLPMSHFNALGAIKRCTTNTMKISFSPMRSQFAR